MANSMTDVLSFYHEATLTKRVILEDLHRVSRVAKMLVEDIPCEPVFLNHLVSLVNVMSPFGLIVLLEQRVTPKKWSSVYSLGVFLGVDIDIDLTDNSMNQRLEQLQRSNQYHVGKIFEVV